MVNNHSFLTKNHQKTSKTYKNQWSTRAMPSENPLLGGWEIMDFWVFWWFFGGFWSKNQKTMVTNNGY